MPTIRALKNHPNFDLYFSSGALLVYFACVGIFSNQIAGNPTFFTVFPQLFFLIITFLFLCIHKNQWPLFLRFEKKWIPFTLFVGTAPVAFVGILHLLAQRFFHAAAVTPTHPWPPLYFISSVVIAPFVEESFFRGILLPSFEKRVGTMRAILITACIFMSAHMVLHTGALALGIVAGILATRTKSVWAAVSFHLGCNLAGGLVVSKFPDVFRWIHWLYG